MRIEKGLIQRLIDHPNSARLVNGIKNFQSTGWRRPEFIIWSQKSGFDVYTYSVLVINFCLEAKYNFCRGNILLLFSEDLLHANSIGRTLMATRDVAPAVQTTPTGYPCAYR